MVSTPRKHHIVPRLHLRRFANARGQVRVVARDALSRSFIASVDDVPAERDFYSFETEDGRSQHVETKLLGLIEAEAAIAIERLIGGQFPPSEEDRARLAAFVAAQWCRGWDMREAMNAVVAHMIQTYTVNMTRTALRNSIRERENRDATDEEINETIEFARDPSRYAIAIPQEHSIRMMVDMVPGLTNVVMTREWQLLRVSEGAFVTSDAPVSLWTHPQNQHPFYGSGFGIADELAIAIDRRHAIVFARKAPSGEIVRDVGTDHLREVNGRTAASGRRYIIHHPDDSPLDGLHLPPSAPKISISPPPFRIVPEDV